MIVAYSYRRYSRPEQGRGDSLRRQEASLAAWLAEHKDARLDTSLRMVDEGKSARRGKHLSDDDACLGQFLREVEAGRVRPGSYLLVESLDRLSREKVLKALKLFLNIITAGIRIVQMAPVQVVYDEGADPTKLVMAIMEMSRAHSESQVKAERVGAAWDRKKQQDARAGRPITKRIPAWLEIGADGRFHIRPSCRAAIRRIFHMSVDGQGATGIAKALNASRTPPISGGDRWTRTYIVKLLRNRALIGEYQPFSNRSGRRMKDGDPIQGYFPAVVDAATFYAARAAGAERKAKDGRPAAHRTNLLTGLLVDARFGGGMHHRTGRAGPTVVGNRAAEGCGEAVPFPAEVLEVALLSKLREVPPLEVVSPLAALEGEAADLRARIAETAAVLAEAPSVALAKVLARHEERLKVVEAEAEAARVPQPALEGLLDLDLEDEAMRRKLRAALRRSIESIACSIYGEGRGTKVALLRVSFKDGRTREYAISSDGAVVSDPEEFAELRRRYTPRSK
jgi:DNA invertase Pin-like site-specific DNA recombinase